MIIIRIVITMIEIMIIFDAALGKCATLRICEGYGRRWLHVVDYDATHHTEKGAVTLRSGRGRCRTGPGLAQQKSTHFEP